MRHLGRFVAGLAAAAATLAWSGSALAAGDLVISQVYGGGGNSGAPYTNDYVELFNRGASTISLSGSSVQYASATGTGNLGANSGQLTELSGSIGPGQYLLVQEAGGATGVPLPTPDILDATPIAMAAGAGKVALVDQTASLGCNGGSAPCSPAQLAHILDLVGYGGANFFEGAGAAPTLSNTAAGLRNGGGCDDTDSNSADFAAGAPAPRTSASPLHTCGVTDTAPSVASTSPADGAAGIAPGSNVTITFSEPVDVAGSWYAIQCGTSGSHTAVVSGGPSTFTLDPDTGFALGETCTVTITATDVTDQDAIDPPDAMASDAAFSFATVAAFLPIREIQGAAQTSPKVGQTVAGVNGIVTAVRSNGYYMQDPSPDGDPATSEGIFVFTSSPPRAAVGDDVTVSGRVSEFTPGGASSANLSTTELASPTTVVNSHLNPLPAASVVGPGGRIPPGAVIEDDGFAVFDPAQDGIDFWESMEGMRVEIDDAVAVGPTAVQFGETAVASAATAGLRTARGGLLLQPGDFNPERVIVDDLFLALPAMNVGDRYDAPVIGVLDYNFGNFFLEATSAGNRIDSGLTREVTSGVDPTQVSVGTFNVENLAPSDGAAKFDRLAGLIVTNLRSPDVVTLEEVQDNSGAADDGTVESNLTLDRLVDAIEAAGGPSYEYRYVAPVDGEDGGQPGGNIRIAYLYRTDRGVAFVDRPGADPTTANGVFTDATGVHLTYSPGRIDPTNPAWTDSRKPLAAEFTLHGKTFFLIGDHFNSKGGDDPLMGRFQPPVRSSETQRHQQAQVENDFVDQILAADAGAKVLVLGDLNDFQFSETVQILTAGGTILHDLVETLPLPERYGYEFEGNAQVLDHILVSSSLQQLSAYDVVHVNAEFADQASDHDPSVVRLVLPTVETLCTLTQQLVTKPGVAAGLCDKLRDGEYKAYANQVDAQTGKSISAADAALLKQRVQVLAAG